MSHLYIKFFFLLIIMSFASPLFSQWQWQNPLPQGNILFGSHFINSSTGYACGDGGTIIKTTDGGESWKINKTKTKESIRSLSFTDENNGWACGLFGTIFKTTNGGLIWDQVISGTTGNLFCVRFLNANTGIIVGDTGIVLKTTDGGNTFLRKQTNITRSLTSCAVFGNVFLTAGLNGAYARSADYGETWQQINTGSNNYLFDIMFRDSLNAFISGAYGTILRSTNAGLSWTGTSTQTGYWFYCISFGDALTGFASSDYGSIFKTTNGGLNWTGLTTSTSEAQYSVKAFSSNDILSVGNKGSIQKSLNSGLNWSGKTSGFRNFIYSVKFINDNTGFGCGGQGSFVKTTNGGIDWIRSQAGGTNDFLFNISMPSENTGYCAGYSGKLIKTTNNGANWETIVLNTQRSLNALYFFNENIGWVCGDSGLLIKTTDGFNSTAVIPADQNFEITDIQFINFNTGWYSSQEKKIYKTTDSGNNWYVPHTGDFGSTVGGIDFYDENSGIAFTYGNKIFITNDGGINWTEKTIPPGNYLNNVHISGAGNFWAIGDYGFIYRSTNAGAIWTEEDDNNFTDRLFGIHFKNNDEGWISGGNGIISKYYNPASGLPVPANTSGFLNGYTLHQNYPNPFNPSTVIKYNLTKKAFLEIKIYDILGNQIMTLISEVKPSGNHETVFNAAGIPSGVYFYAMRADGNLIDTKKMLLLK